MNSVLEWLETAAEKYPGRAAFCCDEKEISFSQMRTLAEVTGLAIREYLGKTAVRGTAAVFGSRAAGTPALFLGAVYAGMAYAPIDAELPVARIAKILENLRPQVILTDAESCDRLQSLLGEISGDERVPVIVANLDAGKIQGLHATFERTIRELTEAEMTVLKEIRRRSVLTDPLYIIYTSGSSGNPKGVITSHLALMTYLCAYREVMDIKGEDVLGNQSPLDYIAAVRDIYLPLLTGCRTVILDRRLFMEPEGLIDCLNEHRITAIGWSVSGLTIPARLGAFQEKQLLYLRKICFSGSVMPCRVLRLWQEQLPEAVFVNQYGPTEATASCTYYVVDHKVREDEILPIGRPYENYKVFLLDAAGEIPDVGEQGEICVAGPALALGYCNDPEGTNRSFVINPQNTTYPERMYRTGDLGSLDEKGILHFHGRLDRQIKHMGHRVELDEVEYAAMALKGIAQACCLYDQKKECLWLFCAGELDKRELARGLRLSLPGFMVPRKIKMLAELPHLPNGKVDMKALENQVERLSIKKI